MTDMEPIASWLPAGFGPSDECSNQTNPNPALSVGIKMSRGSSICVLAPRLSTFRHLGFRSCSTDQQQTRFTRLRRRGAVNTGRHGRAGILDRDPPEVANAERE